MMNEVIRINEEYLLSGKNLPKYVVMFQQTWGSTALGYGGIGGAVMTPAYTVVVSYENHMRVYFGGGRLVYELGYW